MCAMVDHDASGYRLESFADRNKEIQAGRQVSEPKPSRFIRVSREYFCFRPLAPNLHQGRSHRLTIVLTGNDALELTRHNRVTVAVTNVAEFESTAPAFGFLKRPALVSTGSRGPGRSESDHENRQRREESR